jgi:hypothetical protein
MKKIIFCFFVFIFSQQVFCQSTNKTLKITLFAPIYLDSIFDGKSYNFGKKFPRFAVQGIDFVQGAQIALDSFPIENSRIDLTIYDTKSDYLSIGKLIENEQLKNIDLIIGAVKDEDYDLLAAFSKEEKTPFISATYPNDGGITSNPYLIILNPTLKTHCKAIFSYLLQNQDSSKFIHVKQTGNQEDKIIENFENMNKVDKKKLLNIKTINLDSNYTSIRTLLDSNKNNIIIAGSLNESFANNIYNVLSSTDKKYKITLIGMPSWDGFSNLNKKIKESPRNLSFIYTSTYYNDKADTISKTLQDIYLNNYKGKPSEYAYKGFEIFYNFSRILNDNNKQFNKHLNTKEFQLFTEYNIMPVTLEKKSKTVDYYENKHLYFLKKTKNGILKLE